MKYNQMGKLLAEQIKQGREANKLHAKIAAISLGASVQLEPKETEAIAIISGLAPIPDGIEWRPGLNLVDGTIVTWQGKNYIVITGKGHISQAGWDPGATLDNLFSAIRDPYAVWVQPQAHNPYMKGDKVLYPDENGAVYESLVDTNVWSPTAYPQGWALVD